MTEMTKMTTDTRRDARLSLRVPNALMQTLQQMSARENAKVASVAVRILLDAARRFQRAA